MTDFRCIVLNARLSILQELVIACGSLPGKIKVQVSLHPEEFYNFMCVVVFSCQVYMDCGN